MQWLRKNHNSKKNTKPAVIVYGIYIIVTIALGIGGYLYFDYQREKIISSRFEYLASVSEYNNSQISNWLENKYLQLEVLRTNSVLINRIESFTSASGNKEELTEWFTTLKTLLQYEHLILINSDNKIIYRTSNKNTELNRIDSIQSNNSRLAGAVLFSDADDSNVEQAIPKFYVPLEYSNRVSNRMGNVLILIVDPAGTFDRFLNRNVDKSPTLEALLVKNYLGKTEYLNSMKDSTYIINQGTDENRKALVEADIIRSRKGFVEGVDYKNNKVIAIIQKVPFTTWTLLTKIDKTEFYAPMENLTEIVLLTIISADLILGIILFIIWRKGILVNFLKMNAAEIEKAKLESRFDSLINGVKDIAVIILDLKGEIISWNEGARIIEGYNSEEIIGKNISILYSNEERLNNKPMADLDYANEKGSCQEESWRIRKDGTSFWANVLITALRDENKEVYGYLKVTRDLTDKKKNEEDVRKSRDFYLKLLNDFPTPVWRSGSDGKYNYLNKAWINFTGKQLEEELEDGWQNDIHPEEKESVVRLYYDAFRQKQSFMLEFRLRNSFGEYKWVVNFGMPYYDLDNNFGGFLGSCYNIDDRKKYEEAINALMSIGEKLYSSLEINQIIDFLVTESIQMTNAEGGFACVINENIYGIKRYYHINHWEYYEKEYKYDELVFNRPGVMKDTILINHESKMNLIDQDLLKKYNVRHGIITPLLGSNGNLIGYFEIHNKRENREFSKDDVSLLNAVARNASVSIAKSLNYEQLRETEKQLRNSESELRNLAMQLQYAREAERQHIAREVHDELGQLFTGINLNISLLAELLEQNKKPTVEEILDELHSVQQYVNLGIQSVRDISGSLRSYVLDHLGLIPAVQEYCNEIERMSNVKCIFKSDYVAINFKDEKNVTIFRIIQEAITNVLRHAEATEIDVIINQSGNSIEIVVSDNGVGIVEDKESFTNSMGLLGMKERAVFLGGKLKIDSVKNKGTTIRLIVPDDNIETK